MRDYLNYSASDFAKDEFFQSWVLGRDESASSFWNDFRTRYPEKVADMDEARELLSSFSIHRHSLSQDEVSQMWTNIQKRKSEESRSVRLGMPRWAQIAWSAAAVVIVAVGIFFLWPSDQKVQYSTRFGETRTVVLPDSSTVILNANSKIIFNEDMDQQVAREVWVEGEAFFEVVHKVNHQPFRVHMPSGVGVEVLGTSFNVYSRAVDTKVLLNSGQIRLSLPINKEEKKILMKPGELVEFKDEKYVMRNVNTNVYSSWTQRRIVLDQTSLNEMVQMAKDYYGVTIEVDSEKMLGQTVSGSMPIADADNFVNQIGKVFHLKVSKSNNHYQLKAEEVPINQK